MTVNDYLARRDAEWMSPIYEALGLTVGVLQNMQPYEEKRAAYAADITYGTNSEFGFDYLRDNMATSLEEKVQHGGRIDEDGRPLATHHFAIVDEVDNILIDEARTPLIISGAPEQAADLYEQFAKLAPQLEPGKKPEGMDPRAKKEFVADYDYEFDEKHKTVSVTEQGVAKAERFLGIDHLYRAENGPLVNHLIQSLKAESLYKRDVDYAVVDGEVKIIDEFTGRILDGRRWSEGLHQAVEAKEGVRVQEENQTLATITLQNYFRMYDKLAGMTGTALTEATEFMKIYKLPRRPDPDEPPDGPPRPQRPGLQDQGGQVARGRARDRGAPRARPARPRRHDLRRGLRAARPSELRKRGIPHTVLNAKPEHAEREGEIIAEAGRPGAVTIATNMAGRGVDIKLGGNAEHLTQLELAKLGLKPGDPDYEERFAQILPRSRRASRTTASRSRGRRPVHLRHRAPRVAPDRQPAARPRRPPGRPRRVALLPVRRGRPRPPVRRRPHLPHPRPPRPDRRGGQRGADRGQDALEADRERPAQGRGAELPHPQARPRVRRRDEPAARDRLPVPRRGPRGPRHGPGRARARSPRSSSALVDEYTPGDYIEDWDLDELWAQLDQIFHVDFGPDELDRESIDREELKRLLAEDALKLYDEREEELGEELMRALERYLLLQIIDQRWREHLYDMDYLREGIHLRGFAQIEPLVAYKNEAFTLFQDLMNSIWSDFARHDLQRRGRDRGRERRAAAAAAAAGTGGRRSSTPAARRRTSRAPTARATREEEPPRAGAAAPRRRGRAARPQRPVLVRVGQEVQEVPRGRLAPRPGSRRAAGSPPLRALDRQRPVERRHAVAQAAQA